MFPKGLGRCLGKCLGAKCAIRCAWLLALAATGWGCRPGSAGYDGGMAEVAPSDVGAPKKPPALRFTHLAAPPLPDLPVLGAHEAPVPAPLAPHAPPDLDTSPCRAVWTGSQSAPLACARAFLFGENDGEGAVPIVSRKLLARDVAALPAVADHRLDGTEGPVRDQSSAPACTAFATATALDHALLRWGGERAVSVMQIWSRYHSPHVDKSLASNLGLDLGAEQRWPFSASEALSWIPCEEFAKPPRSGCGKAVDGGRSHLVATDLVGEFTEIEYLAAPPDVATLEAKLAAGQDVIVAMELPAAFVPRGRAGARYVPHYTKSAGADAGHALVLAGYARLPHGTYFLAHNSWGTAWGDAGYAWIHEQTIAQWTRQAMAVDAEPAERTAVSRPRRSRGATTCEGNLVPDSIRGTCAPACPDGSPRHDGVCPVAGQCPPGYVNLTGACVLAAPVVTGSDPSTRVAWTCGAGGCSYVLPRAADPECTGASCKASCPAPDFHVARMRSSIVCIE